ncbi:hypothetical protein IXO97_023080 (plasmid) [Xanthomonas oryzae pv. oryzae]|nr:hypothetical protein IXO97_023080 [Xanthomonas oryzae pv. oryzae]
MRHAAAVIHPWSHHDEIAPLVGFGIHGLATFEPTASNAAFSSPINDNAWLIYLVGVFCGLGGLFWIA